jgi:ABC-type amino acid transport substrate-binding protein
MKKLTLTLTIALVMVLSACGYKGNFDYISIDAEEYGIATGYAIAFPKSSPLISPFNDVLDLMITDGTLDALNAYWVSKDKNNASYLAIDFTEPAYNLAHNGNGKTLTFVTSSGYDPFEMADAEGVLSGFDIDLAKFIAKELNYTIKWENVEFDKIVGDLKNAKADAAFAAITPTDDRKQSVSFSIDYFTESYTVAVFRSDDEVTSLDDLKGKVVGAQSGTVQASLIEKLKAEGVVKDVILLDYPASAMQSLKTNKIDAFFVEQSVADDLFKTYNK